MVIRLLLATLLLPLTATAQPLCPSSPAPAPGALIGAAMLQERGDAYLGFATATLHAGSPVNVIAHLERRRRDPGFAVDIATVSPAALADVFAKIDTMEDPSDFDMMYLLWLWLGARRDLPADTAAAIEQRLLAFKYWYTDPTPPGIIDDKWYWSENHRIIFHMLEYLAGQEFPDRVFSISGLTGAAHRARARARILAWIEERSRFGFFEWHSNVYYLKDINPLLLLAEYAADEEIACRAAMVLDALLLDIAVHLQQGVFGAPHGRSYMKDKWSGLAEDTFGLQKLLFDDTAFDYASSSDAGVLGFVTARRYRPPEVLRRIARSERVGVDRQRMGVRMDLFAPLAAPTRPPAGFSYSDPEDLAFWWSMGAITAWPVLPLTLQTIEQYSLWDTELFQDFATLRPFAADVGQATQLAHGLARAIAFGLTAEVNTYTWRSPEVSLATAQDYRAGDYGAQYHAWQATLDAEALVFTTLPTDPVTRSPLLQWPDGDGYWSGTIMPRSAQHQRVGMHVYAPQYVSSATPPFDAFAYQPSTHAFLPQERFDEVRRRGNWTIARKGQGYLALWSWRLPDWQPYSAETLAARGFTQSFDLVAPGGADNVWIVEVARAAEWPSFDAFAAAVEAAPVTAAPLGTGAGGVSRGFDVRYGSPSAGLLTFGTSAPLTVDGRVQRIHDYPRMHNAWVYARHGSRALQARDGGYSMRLHFPRGLRLLSAPASP